MTTLEEFVLESNNFVVAHRGSSGTAPENTMAAFRQALDAGAKMIETDIQISADNKVICFHDAELGRTSNGEGYAGEKTYPELLELDAGSWFNPEYRNEKIPLLEDLIGLIRERAFLNIEIKSRPVSDVHSRLGLILDVIRKYDFMQQVLFSSFDHRLLQEIKKTDKSLHTAAIMVPGDRRLPSGVCGDTGAEAFVCSTAEINLEIAEDAKANNIYTGVYSFDDEKQLPKAFEFDVKAIVTNFPKKIIDLLERKNF